jgi:hypothetical protein
MGCCFPKQIDMELNFGGSSNCNMNMSKIGNVVVGIFGCPDMNNNLISDNNTNCYGYSSCTYFNTLNINKEFLPNSILNFTLITLNTCAASLGTIQCKYIPAFVYLQIINNNFAIVSRRSINPCSNSWNCSFLLLQNNMAFSYLI